MCLCAWVGGWACACVGGERFSNSNRIIPSDYRILLLLKMPIPSIKLHAVVVLEHFLSEQWPLLQVCVYLDGSNAENKIALLVILCIIMYVKKKRKEKKKFKTDIFFFTKPITDYGKMLKYREKYRSLSICYTPFRDSYKSLPRPPFTFRITQIGCSCLLIGRN